MPLSARSNDRPTDYWLEGPDNFALADIHPEKDRVCQSVNIRIQRTESFTENARQHRIDVVHEVS